MFTLKNGGKYQAQKRLDVYFVIGTVKTVPYSQEINVILPANLQLANQSNVSWISTIFKSAH